MRLAVVSVIERERRSEGELSMVSPTGGGRLLVLSTGMDKESSCLGSRLCRFKSFLLLEEPKSGMTSVAEMEVFYNRRGGQACLSLHEQRETVPISGTVHCVIVRMCMTFTSLMHSTLAPKER